MKKQALYGMIEVNPDSGLTISYDLYSTPEAAIMSLQENIAIWAADRGLDWKAVYQALINDYRCIPEGGTYGGYIVFSYEVAG